MIRSIVIDRDPINIIDSGIEAPLVGPRWTITNTYSGDIRVSLALPDKINQTYRIKLVDAYRLYRSAESEVVKLVIKRALDTITFEGLDTLLNPNLLQEASVYMHNLLWKFRGK